MYKQLASTLIAATLALGAQAALADPAADLAAADKTIANGDLITGMERLKALADGGYAPAQARYGEILDKAEEDKLAVEYYRKAAEQGNAAGIFGLGLEYLSGEGFPKDIDKGREHVQRAAEMDHLPAVKAMAASYKAGSMGLPVDPEKAAVWDAKAKALEPPPPPPAKADAK